MSIRQMCKAFGSVKWCGAEVPSRPACVSGFTDPVSLGRRAAQISKCNERLRRKTSREGPGWHEDVRCCSMWETAAWVRKPESKKETQRGVRKASIVI